MFKKNVTELCVCHRVAHKTCDSCDRVVCERVGFKDVKGCVVTKLCAKEVCVRELCAKLCVTKLRVKRVGCNKIV